MRERISLEQCRPGDIIAQDIIDIGTGNTLCRLGHILTQETIFWLKKFSHSDIYIEKSTLAEIWNLSPEVIASYSTDKIKLNRVLSSLAKDNKVPEKALEEVKDSFFGTLNHNTTIVGCINIMKTFNDYLYSHSMNVGMLAVLLGRWLGLSTAAQGDLFLAGVLHDVGKYKLNQALLTKPKSLTRLERLAIMKHVLDSYMMIKDNPSISTEVKLGVLSHHEHIDGTGYPRNLSADDIPYFGKVLAVVDLYDKLLSERSFNKEVTAFSVIEKMFSEQMGVLDTKMLLTFLDNIATYYIGVQVKLSNGLIGKVVFIPPQCPYKPMVECEGTFINLETTPDIQILEML